MIYLIIGLLVYVPLTFAFFAALSSDGILSAAVLAPFWPFFLLRWALFSDESPFWR